VDGAKPFKQIGTTFKQVGNGGWGKMGERKSKWTKTMFCNKEEMLMLTNRVDYLSSEKIGENYYQCSRLKRRIEWDRPVQTYVAVYQNAKVALLDFCFNFLYKILDPLKYETLATDTDCVTLCLTDEFENCIADRPLYEKLKHKYFPRFSKEISHCITHAGSSYPITIAAADHRKGGLWKVESEGTYAACIGPKMTLLGIEKNSKNKFAEIGLKLSLKGCVNDQWGALNNWISQKMKNSFTGIILGQQAAIESINRGFMLRKSDQRMTTYQQRKDVASYFHCKSIILPDCVHTSLTPL